MTQIPLSVAALRLKVPYRTVLDWVTRGRLVGGRDPYGHWFADEDHVARLANAAGPSPEAVRPPIHPPREASNNG